MKCFPVFFFLFLLAKSFAQDVRAVDSLQRLLARSKEDSNRVLLLLNLASTYENKETDSADKYYRAALNTSEKINAPFYVAKTITWYTFVLNVQGKLDEALRLNLRAYDIAKTLHNPNLLSSTPANVGNTYVAKAEYENALQYYFEALPNVEALGNKTFLATLCNNISATYRSLKQPDKALQYAQRALSVAIGNGDSTGIGDAYQQIGNSYDALQRYEPAIVAYTKSEKMAKALGDDYLRRTTLGSIGSMLLKQKKFSEAVPYILSSLALAKKSNDEEHYVQGNEYLTECYLGLNDVAKADSIIQRILPNAERHRWRETLRDIYLDASTVESRKANAAGSQNFFDKWKALNDSLMNETLLKSTAELEAKYHSAEKEKQIATLQTEQQIQKLQLQKRNGFIIGLSASVFFLCLVAWLLYRNLQRKKAVAEKEAQIRQQTIVQLQQEKQLSAADAMLRGQEEERNRLAKDLHDGLGGRLSGIKQNLNAMKGAQIITEENAFTLNKIISQLDGSIDELRSISRNMMPEALIRFGLKDALQDYCSSLSESGQLQITYQTFGLDERLSQQAEIILFRIVQELLNNVVKHAAAKTAIVQLVQDETRLHLTVEDDGKGFDTAALQNVQGIGWLSIKSRVDYFNGTTDLRSLPQQGTSVNIEFQNAELT